MSLRFPFAVLCLGWMTALPAVAQQRLVFKTGDHVCLIGNTLAERMQHDGWLEAILHFRYPSTTSSSATSASRGTN